MLLLTTTLRDLVRQAGPALRTLLVMTVLLGVAYPAAVWAVGRAVPGRADGQLLSYDGRVVGSALLGQDFRGERWFHGRPSAAAYDGLASAASNLGPSDPGLLRQIEKRRAAVAEREDVARADVPPDAVTASGSGLDPQISPAYAELQVARVARANDLPVAEVRRMVDDATSGPFLGIHGDPAVNVLELNLAVAGAVAGTGG